MTGATVDVDTRPDGTVVIQPHGDLAAENAVELRRTLVHAVRRLRPLRLILDLHDVADLDPINLGILAAACQLGDDHRVAVFLDHSTPAIAGRLFAAGVPHYRLRHTGHHDLKVPSETEAPSSAPPPAGFHVPPSEPR